MISNFPKPVGNLALFKLKGRPRLSLSIQKNTFIKEVLIIIAMMETT